MGLLGVIENDKIDEEINNAFQKEGEKVLFVREKEELLNLSGVIIPLTEKEQVTEAISWLLECRNYPTLFVWIFSTIQLQNEASILIKLGANTVIYDKNQFSNFISLVKNDVQRIDYKFNEKRHESEQIINTENQSVYVNGIEIGLTRREYEAFSLLYANQGTCVPYTQIMNKLWPNAPKLDVFRIANIIFHLRNKVKESKEFQIVTVRNKGYTFYYKN